MATNAGHALARAYQIIDDMGDVDADLAQGHNNVVAVLMRAGFEREAAMARALGLAHEHLAQATTHARWLPANSGQALVQLCEKLQASMHVSQPLGGKAA